MYDYSSREKRAYRMIKTLEEYFGKDRLSSLTVLDIGSSTGIIDNILSTRFKKVIGSDIDEEAINYAKENFKNKNLQFRLANGINLNFKSNIFDVVICAQVYEHVPNQKKLFSEIYRVLKPRGVCYLAALNKLRILEPHYGLPFLSWLPKNLANLYLKLTGKGKFYFETLRTYWELKEMNKRFRITDWTREIILNPKKYGYDDKIPSNPVLSKPLQLVSVFYKFFSPTFFWIMTKPLVTSNAKKFSLDLTPTPTFLYRNYLYKRITSKFLKNSFFLDIGTGNGILLRDLLKLGFKGEAIDISEEAIEFAKMQLGERNQKIIKYADLFKYSPKRLYDAVLCFETLEHIMDDELAMKKIYTLLRLGGVFILSVPAHISRWSTLDELKGHFRRYERGELINKLLTSGFQIQNIYSYGFPFLVFIRKISSRGKLLRSKSKKRGIKLRTKESSIEQEYNPKLRFLINELILRPLFKFMDLFLKSDLGIGYIVIARKNRSINK